MPVMLERWNDEKMDGLEATVDSIERRMEKGFERLDDRFYELQKETKEGFDAMHRSMTRNAIMICGIFIAALVAWPG